MKQLHMRLGWRKPPHWVVRTQSVENFNFHSIDVGMVFVGMTWYLPGAGACELQTRHHPSSLAALIFQWRPRNQVTVVQ